MRTRAFNREVRRENPRRSQRNAWAGKSFGFRTLRTAARRKPLTGAGCREFLQCFRVNLGNLFSGLYTFAWNQQVTRIFLSDGQVVLNQHVGLAPGIRGIALRYISTLSGFPVDFQRSRFWMPFGSSATRIVRMARFQASQMAFVGAC